MITGMSWGLFVIGGPCCSRPYTKPAVFGVYAKAPDVWKLQKYKPQSHATERRG